MPDDDFLYAQVAKEISDGQIDRTTWTRAFAHSGGADDATKSLYIRFRVESLREQFQQAVVAARKEQQAAIQTAKQRALAGQAVTCPHCGHHGEPIKEPRGNMAICLLLCLAYVIPGIIYYLCASGYRYKCAKCGTVFHKDLIA
jgi:DNA-directed RNA polymerase subunit RPC12/RpoP